MKSVEDKLKCHSLTLTEGVNMTQSRPVYGASGASQNWWRWYSIQNACKLSITYQLKTSWNQQDLRASAFRHGSAPSNRIWNITILRSPKQQIWLRTALCGGWCRRMALRNRELHARNDDDDDAFSRVEDSSLLCLSAHLAHQGCLT